MNNHTALLHPTLSGLVPLLSIIGISTLIAYVLNVPRTAHRILSGRATRWITTTGEVTSTSLSVRKQAGTYRDRIDFVVQVDYTYCVDDDNQNPPRNYLGTQSFSVSRLDIARNIAAKYEPGAKIAITYNAFDATMTRLSTELQGLS
jgi:hypothetical protein